MHRLVIALVTLLGLTGAAVVGAYLFLFSSGIDRAARLAPAETAIYVNVYLQPSAGQQMNLSELIGRLPGFADDATLDEKVDQIVQNLLADAGVDYRTQLKPWLGNQVALAVMMGDTTTSADGEPVVIAEVKDRPAAEAAVTDLVSADDPSARSTRSYEGTDIHVSTDAAYAFIDEMLVIGPDASAVEAIVDVSRGADALADRGDFRDTMAELPADHLAAAFLDLALMARAADAEGQLQAVSTAGAVLVAERDGLRLSGSAPFDHEEAEPSARAGFALGGEPTSLVDWMPGNTVAEVVVFGLRQTLEDAEAAAAGTPDGQELLSAIDTFRALAAFGLGIDVDADLLPLLDREVGVAFRGFDGDRPSGLLLLRPDDPVAAEASLARITDRLSAIGAETTTEEIGGVTVTVVQVPDIGELAYTVSGRIVVMGFGSDDVVAAIDAHDSGTSLGQSRAYRETWELAGVRAGNEAWVDVAALVALVDPAELDGDARDILGRIGTLGLTAPSRDDQIEFHAVLTIPETRPD
jgi:hypothetical protein